jgi:hypothetical protein
MPDEADDAPFDADDPLQVSSPKSASTQAVCGRKPNEKQVRHPVVAQGEWLHLGAIC